MTARQVMEEIKTLTPEERGQIVDFLHQLDPKVSEETSRKRDIKEIGAQVFERHADLMRKLAS